MIRYYHIFIAGFTQTMGHGGNGIDGAEHTIHSKFASPNTRSWYLPWYCAVGSYAESVFRYSDKPKLQIAGYSFGGQTACDLCEALSARGLQVNRLTLIDPVRRRSKTPLGWLSALNPLARITVPSNVRKLTVYRQRTNWPRGHQINIASPGTVLSDDQVLPFDHQHIDNAPLVQKHLITEAELLHG